VIQFGKSNSGDTRRGPGTREKALSPGILSVAAALRARSRHDSKGITVLVTPVTKEVSAARLVRNLGTALEHLHERPVLVLDMNLNRDRRTRTDPSFVDYTLLDDSERSAQLLLPDNGDSPKEHLTLARINVQTELSNEVFASPWFRDFIEAGREHYKYLLIEGAPLASSEETLVVSQVVTGVVLVVSADLSTMQEVRAAREAVRRSGGRVLGFVFDKSHWKR
jgi:hypothetical protein